MSDAFRYLPPEKAFLDPNRADSQYPEAASAVVIPFGLESSVSYGAGTREGPAAILGASHQLELFDDELWCQPCDQFGIATLDVAQPDQGAAIAPELSRLEGVVSDVLDAGRFPFVLGGEHSVTAGAVRAFAERFDDLVVLQFDAHADLRDGYLGEHFSHASAMRRVLDFGNVSLVSLGIRAISAGEVAYFEANRDRVSLHLAKDQADWDVAEIVAPLKGRPVYITFDIDGLDGAVMPATGTPTPGGLSYAKSLGILRAACRAGNVVGCDLVELAPIEGFNACNFLAAQLAYKMMAYALAKDATRGAAG